MERRERDRLFRLGIALQALASALTGAGIAIEIVLRADIGYILITAGSFVFAIATKLMNI